MLVTTLLRKLAPRRKYMLVCLGGDGGGKSFKRIIVFLTVRHICWLGVGNSRHAACLPPLTEHVFWSPARPILPHSITTFPPPNSFQHCLVVAALNVHPKNSPAPGRQKGSVALGLRHMTGRERSSSPLSAFLLQTFCSSSA